MALAGTAGRSRTGRLHRRAGPAAGGLLPVLRRDLVPGGGGERGLWAGSGFSALCPAYPAPSGGPVPPEIRPVCGDRTALLLALYGAACLYTGGTWFLSAALWTVFGLGILLLPPLLPQLPLPWSWDRHKALVYLSFETLLLLAGLAWEGRAGGFLLPMLPTAALCLTLPWGLLGLLRYLPWNRWFRAGAALGWTALWLWLFPFGMDQLYLVRGGVLSHPYRLLLPVDFTDWTSPNTLAANVILLILLGLLLLAFLCVAVGFRRQRQNTRPAEPPEP